MSNGRNRRYAGPNTGPKPGSRGYATRMYGKFLFWAFVILSFLEYAM